MHVVMMATRTIQIKMLKQSAHTGPVLAAVQAEWWNRLPSEPAPGSPDAAAAADSAADAGVSISHVFQEGTWVVIQQDDAKKPLPRYEQGAALMGPNLYIMGGHYSE